MDSMPLRRPATQTSQERSTDPHLEPKSPMDHYIGIDVGTGSARACIINSTGEIVGLASENIGLWQPEQGYYVCSRCLQLPLFHPTTAPNLKVRRTLLIVVNHRSNQQTISGDASARRSSELCNKTTLILPTSVASASTRLALLPSSPKTPTSQFQ